MANVDLIRLDGRRSNELRPVKIHRSFIKYAEGSVLIEMGCTKVICTATVEEKVPQFMRAQNRGWMTAEYAMIPRATRERAPQTATKGKPRGTTAGNQR